MLDKFLCKDTHLSDRYKTTLEIYIATLLQ